MAFYFLTYIQTIMDKSLGTNLHLWRFFKRAKTNSHMRIPLHLVSRPTYNVGHVISPEFQHCMRGVKQRNLKRITVLF